MPDHLATTSKPFTPADALAGDQDAILSHLERSMPVRLIATLGTFTAAYVDEPISDAIARADESRFDYLPVQASASGAVVGLFKRREAHTGATGLVRDHMEPLGAGNLIAIDAPLLQFVMTADTNPCRLVLDDTEIRGLVTLSDIQRLPVRTALFGLFIHLELLLTDRLRRELGSDQSPFDRLPPKRAEKARDWWEKSRRNDLDADPFNALQFADKRTLAERIKLCGEPRKKIAKELGKIETRLRNPIAHGAGYGLSLSSAHKTIEASCLLWDWIQRLRQKI